MKNSGKYVLGNDGLQHYIPIDSTIKSSLSEIIRGLLYTFYSPIMHIISDIKFYAGKTGLIKVDGRFETISKYKNLHKGKRCFLIATGPSLSIEDLELLENEFTISMNSIVKLFDKTDFRPTYYMCSDYLTYSKIQHAQTIMNPSSVFIGIGNINTKWNISLSDVCNQEDKEINLFRIDRSKTLKNIYFLKSKFKPKFSNCIEKEAIDGGTVLFLAMQLAVYMGFSELYLVGVDCNYLGAKARFDDSDISFKEAELNAFRMIEAYNCALKFTSQRGIKIYNATRGGSLEVFPRKSLEDVLGEK